MTQAPAAGDYFLKWVLNPMETYLRDPFKTAQVVESSKEAGDFLKDLTGGIGGTWKGLTGTISLLPVIIVAILIILAIVAFHTTLAL